MTRGGRGEGDVWRGSKLMEPGTLKKKKEVEDEGCSVAS
jgi:hypothetical protein